LYEEYFSGLLVGVRKKQRKNAQELNVNEVPKYHLKILLKVFDAKREDFFE
jgi:hypothetical protein